MKCKHCKKAHKNITADTCYNCEFMIKMLHTCISAVNSWVPANARKNIRILTVESFNIKLK